MLKNFLIVIYFFLIFLIIVFVLLQQGRGADAGISFSSTKITNNIFGSKGSDNILFILTLFFFISFLIVALILTRVTNIEYKKNMLDNTPKEEFTTLSTNNSNDRKLLPKVPDVL